MARGRRLVDQQIMSWTCTEDSVLEIPQVCCSDCSDCRTWGPWLWMNAILDATILFVHIVLLAIFTKHAVGLLELTNDATIFLLVMCTFLIISRASGCHLPAAHCKHSPGMCSELLCKTVYLLPTTPMAIPVVVSSAAGIYLCKSSRFQFYTLRQF